MAEQYKGMTYLKNKLNVKRSRVLTRYEYYDMKAYIKDYSKALPEGYQWLAGTLGWCTKAVDSLADRLTFREFSHDNFDLNEIFRLNNPDVLYDSAILSALIASCSFVYISQDAGGYPRLQVIDGGNATGIMDPITGLLTEGYAVLQRDDNKKVILDAYFTTGKTEIFERGKRAGVYQTNAPYPLLVPIVFRPDAARAFGHSRISRSCMSIMQSALRTIKRSEISGEFYSYPQRYALGLDDEIEGANKWKATMSSMFTASRDEDGNLPQLGQFPQQSMSPYVEQLRMFASLFAGECGLTLDDLGFPQDNPSSAEAIKSAHENLRLTASKAQRTFGSGLLNVGYLAACVRDDYSFQRNQFYQTRPEWEPIFTPDASMLSLIGDGAIKINQAMPGYFGKDNMRNLTGIPASEEPVVVDTGE